MTVNVLEPPDALNSSKVGSTVKVGGGVTTVPACVTSTFCINVPAVTVMVAFLSVDEVLADTFTLIVVPPFPHVDETVTHPPELFVINQSVLEVILNDFMPADAGKSSVSGETVMAGATAAATCVTVTVCLGTPGASK